MPGTGGEPRVAPFLIVLSAPSGAGKSTIARRIVAGRDDVAFSVSATTRRPRGEEREGEDYYYLSRAEFDRRVAAHEFLEWAEYGGNLYGTLQEEVDRILRLRQHVLLEIEVQGARLVRQRSPNVVSIFILPPSGAELVRRLRGRRTETAEALTRRLEQALEEIGEAVEYDYIVVNDDLNRAVAEVNAIIDTEARRPFRLEGFEEFMNALRDTLARDAETAREGQE